jgi:tetratricopeptide (TPR) repeat protein
VRFVEDVPPSYVKAEVLGQVSRYHMLGNRPEALSTGRVALDMATELGLAEVRSQVLDNLGTARVHLGDADGIRDLERSIEIADEIGSPEGLRGYNNLFSSYVTLARLDEAAESIRAGLEVAERFGGAGANARWLRFERIHVSYWQGDWDRSAELIDGALSEVGPTHALSRWSFEMRGRIRLARDDVAGALEDAEKSLPLARQAKDPQTLLPALSFAAFAFLEAGRTREAERLADELLALDVAGRRIPHHISPVFDLAWVLTGLGRAADLIEAVGRVTIRTGWIEAAELLGRGDYLSASHLYEEIGTRPNEAYTRLRAAAKLAEQGRRAEADEQLQRALAFWRSVGARRYVREGESLFAATG